MANGVKTLDADGRLELGSERANEAYVFDEGADGTITLIPLANIPERERWLWENPAALASVRRGLAQSARSETAYLGSFAEYLEDEDKD